MPAYYLPILAGIQHAELRRRRVTLCLARRVMEPGYLLLLALSCPPSGNGRRLKSKTPICTRRITTRQFV